MIQESMNSTSLAYAVEREQLPEIDEEALRRRVEARAGRADLAHRTVFVESHGWSEHVPDKPGYYYFADRDDDTYVIVEVACENGESEIHHLGSDIAFPPDAMDGKWKPVPVPLECLKAQGEASAEEQA